MDMSGGANCDAWHHREYGALLHIRRSWAIIRDYMRYCGIVGGAKRRDIQMTQNDRILRHMRDIGSITQLEAISEYGIMRLASRISDLKRDGYEISREMVRGKNRYGEVTSYARYTLNEKRA